MIITPGTYDYLLVCRDCTISPKIPKEARRKRMETREMVDNLLNPMFYRNA